MSSAPDSGDPAVDSTAPTEHAAGDPGSLRSLLEQVAGTGGSVALAPGTVVGGQYRIERAVGAGGMGVVYLAADQRLGREVAIKLGAARSAAALARLQREAGALARLSHPNVVVVYQVGEHDGRVYIAMEYVAGGTARTWVSARSRGWAELVALYAAAGDGLAAAHAAGLIHRDFKPDNVLVGPEGRPRVADFGLVRAIASGELSGEATADTRDLAETRAGAIMGTPAYMPPEQLAGGDLDERADQFAFCASVWEALFGARPFAGETPEAVKAAIESSPPLIGERREQRRRVPRHVVDALRRGLRAEREQRWPSMAPLLVALRHDPSARRRRVALVLGGAAVAAAIAIPLALRAGRAPDPCTDGPAALAPTWSPARSARVAAAVGPRAWPALQSRLDAYARAWALGHRDACRATRVARSQSEDLLDRRMACLDRARVTLGVTLDVIEHGGPSVAARAPAAIEGLPGLDACADTAGLAETAPLPTDPTARARVAEATQLVASAQAATYEDMKPGMEALSERAVTAARAGGWKPQIAEALATRANVAYDSGHVPESIPLFQEAAEMALAGGSDRIAARMLADLAWAHAASGAHDEATRALALARALWERGGKRPADARKILNTGAYLAQQAGRDDEAVAIMRDLIAVIEAGGAIGSPAADHYNLASALMGAGRVEEGLPSLERAIATAERDDGPNHANVARYLSLRAWGLRRLGKLDEAVASARRSIAIYQDWFGPDDFRIAYPLESLAEALNDQGELVEAEATFARAAELGRAHGSFDAAAALERRVAAILLARKELPRAAELAARAVATVEHGLGPATPELIRPLLMVAEVADARGQLVVVARSLERAVAIAGRAEVDPELMIESHLALADVRWTAGDHAAAHALVDAAATRAAGTPALVEAIGAWHAAHR